VKTFEYRPETIKVEGADVPSPFDGVIKIEIPTYKERMALIRSWGLTTKGTEDIDKGIKLNENVEKFVLSVDLKIKATGEEIKSLEDLGYYKEGSFVINELGSLILGGFSLNPK
jgi:hypothetical protein